MYEEKEDSYLILKETEKIKKSVCLDIGSGNFIISKNLIKQNKKVIATDIDIKVFKEKVFKELQKNKNFLYLNTNLLKPFKRKFDYIFFNPPYLPYDEREGYKFDTTGGKKGWEITINFLKDLHKALKIDGSCFLIVSNFTKNKVDSFINKSLFEYEIKDNISFYPFEKIWLYEIKYNHFLKKLNKKIKKILEEKDFEFFNKGKRSIIIKLKEKKSLRSKLNLIKIGDEKTINKEYFYLKKIEKKGKKILKNFEKIRFIPRFEYKENILFLEEIKGKNYKKLKQEFLTSNNQKKLNEIKLLLKKSLVICFLLDLFKINKFEMNHPEKHIILTEKGRVVFIDFERSTFSKKTKNLTQFSFFIFKELKEFRLIEEKEKDKLKELLQKYKKDKSWKKVKEIINFFFN